MKLELLHTVINGAELFSVCLNGKTHKACKTQDEAMKYYEEIKKLVERPYIMPEMKVDVYETILTEEI
jgi:hypothetical protein